jgi:hypothetical protein
VEETPLTALPPKAALLTFARGADDAYSKGQPPAHVPFHGLSRSAHELVHLSDVAITCLESGEPWPDAGGGGHCGGASCYHRRAEAQERKAWIEKYAKELERARSLRSRAIASVSDDDQVESTYLAARAPYERAQQSLRVAELGNHQEEKRHVVQNLREMASTSQEGSGNIVLRPIFMTASSLLGFLPLIVVPDWLKGRDKAARKLDVDTGRGSPRLGPLS